MQSCFIKDCALVFFLIARCFCTERKFGMKAVITVVGVDKPGIIAKVSDVLYKNDINVLDISQTIMEDMFTMIMMVDMRSANNKTVSEELQKVADNMGLSIHVQNEEIFRSMHRI